MQISSNDETTQCIVAKKKLYKKDYFIYNEPKQGNILVSQN